jgi:hypothetical protein
MTGGGRRWCTAQISDRLQQLLAMAQRHGADVIEVVVGQQRGMIHVRIKSGHGFIRLLSWLLEHFDTQRFRPYDQPSSAPIKSDRNNGSLLEYEFINVLIRAHVEAVLSRYERLETPKSLQGLTGK